MDLKTCRVCRVSKPLADFYRRSINKDGYAGECKDCAKQWQDANRKAHPEKRRERDRRNRQQNREKIRCWWRAWRLKNVYGLTESALQELWAQQRESCAICGRHIHLTGVTDGLVVDHRHDTGAVRGLLCRQCNCALGLLQEDTSLLRRAVKYLEQHQ